MAWTATLVSVEKDSRNPQNIKAHVRLTDGAEVIDLYPIGNDLDDTNLKRWLHTIVAKNLAERDAALPKIQALVGQAVAIEEPVATPLQQARQGVRAIIGIQQMKAAVTDQLIADALTARSNALQSQLKAFMQNNPTVKIEDLF